MQTNGRGRMPIKLYLKQRALGRVRSSDRGHLLRHVMRAEPEMAPMNSVTISKTYHLHVTDEVAIN